MHQFPFAALMLGSAAAMMEELPPVISLPEPPRRGRRAVKIRTGKTYPHSSTRQRARYARQIAAGQIKNTA